MTPTNELTREAKLLGFAAQIARMTTGGEKRYGMASEDAIDTVNSLIAEARKLTGIEPGYPQVWCELCDTSLDRCDCEAPGRCLTCGTQCDDEGICPVCAALEQAEEAVREATLGVIPSAYRPEERQTLAKARAAREKAKDASIDACRKCGEALTLRDITDGSACVDQGEGEEAGRVFVYCSSDCMEAH
jgi:hypothetical protein